MRFNSEAMHRRVAETPIYLRGSAYPTAIVVTALVMRCVLLGNRPLQSPQLHRTVDPGTASLSRFMSVRKRGHRTVRKRRHRNGSVSSGCI